MPVIEAMLVVKNPPFIPCNIAVISIPVIDNIAIIKIC